MSQQLAINAPVEPGNFEIIWEPQEGSQTIAMDSRCDHTLYEGARGPGKTVTQLMRFLRLVGKGYGAFWKGIIFDLEFDHLGGLVAESKKWFNLFDDGAKFYESTSAYKWVWPTGEELLFRHVKKIGDYEGFHGHEYPFIGWNELTKHASSALYDKFMSCNRSSFDPITNTPHIKNNDGSVSYLTKNGMPLPPIPLEVFSTTNPNGPGHNWVKRRFIDIAPRGRVVRITAQIYNPQTKKEETHTKTQIAIFGSYRENRFLDPKYIVELETLKDKNLRRSWLYGDWSVTAGGAFDDVWDEVFNVVPRFVVPSGWRLKRTFDWGSTHPFSVGWWAEANGEEAIMPDGRTFGPPAGSLIRFNEWYGCQLDGEGKPDYGSNKGLKLAATRIAEGIRDREISLMENNWISEQPMAGPADNQIRNVNESETDTIEKKMAKVGVRWTASDKSKGSRKIGLEIAREIIDNAKTCEGPALYVMEHCRAFIATLPTLTRDPDNQDDVNTEEEDHIWDETRYCILDGSLKSARKLKILQAN